MKGFCEKKFRSILISGTFTKAVMYLMLLSDSIIAGFFIGEPGVAGINAITPVTAVVTFFGDLVSTGVGIVFTREVGAMRKRRADEIYGQGLIISIGIGLISALLIFVYLRFGKDNFPFILKDMESDIVEMDDKLTSESAGKLSDQVKDAMLSHGYQREEALRAALFVEEIGLTVIEKNKQAKKPVLIELSLFFEDDSVLIIERDSGKLFDITDPDLHIEGLSSMILNGLMDSQKEKAYLVTTGYNRNMIRFRRKEKAVAETL